GRGRPRRRAAPRGRRGAAGERASADVRRGDGRNEVAIIEKACSDSSLPSGERSAAKQPGEGGWTGSSREHEPSAHRKQTPKQSFGKPCATAGSRAGSSVASTRSIGMWSIS